ncbi:hypothetical protein [Butyrivibrio sp. JL13D10]|uniref:hypothetical protein n=1 Tax=Butyrivibrio sp. JL13D10 TaxID=3236815 RepID=UPI0038B69A7C
MTDKNIKNFSDEELEEVAGGTTTFGVGAQIKKKQEKEAFVEEAKKRFNPKDPSSWFQTVADLFNERGGIK